MGLHDLKNDDTVVKCMVTKDKKEMCYLHYLFQSVKSHECESYNALVDLPEVKKYPVNPAKTSHSKRDWNKLSTVLNRSPFDSTVNVLELNTDNKITFVVKMMKANVLIPLFEPVNSTLVSTAELNELNLIKLKLPSKEELIGIVEGKSEMYNHRIEDRLSCNMCKRFVTPDNENVFQFPDHFNVHISFILNV